MTNERRLQRLVVDPTDVAEDELADALERYVRLTPDGHVVFHAAYGELKAKEQVLCFLLGLKAAELLGLRESAVASPQEVQAETGMAGGTVRPKLSALVKDRLVVKAAGGYAVPVHAVSMAANVLDAAPDAARGA